MGWFQFDGEKIYCHTLLIKEKIFEPRKMLSNFRKQLPLFFILQFNLVLIDVGLHQISVYLVEANTFLVIQFYAISSKLNFFWIGKSLSASVSRYCPHNSSVHRHQSQVLVSRFVSFILCFERNSFSARERD